MKRFSYALAGILLLTGCSENVVEIHRRLYNNSVEYLDMNSIHSSGWNKKVFTMITIFPLTNEKTITWQLEIDCDKKLIRMNKDPSAPNIKSYTWNVIGNSGFEHTNTKDLMLYSLICKK